MQSGISVSQELASQFSKLQTDDSLFGLLVSIESEALVPVKTLPKTSSDFARSLDELQPYLKPDQALYVILRRYDHAGGSGRDEPPPLVAITYIPDSAKVRQKMLFASSRLTLVRELGTEHFRETIFATTAEELTKDGFERHARHAQLEAPLTEEERSLAEVKRAEAEAGAGTGIREIHLSKNMNMPVAADALDALQALSRDGRKSLVMLVRKL